MRPYARTLSAVTLGAAMLFATAAIVVTPALAPPAAAQSMTGQEAHQVAETALAAWNKAFAAKDSVALANLCTEDVVFFKPPPKSVLNGREATAKNWANEMKGYDPDPYSLVDARPIDKDTIWVVYAWSGTYMGPKGPEHPSGQGARIYVRDGDTWKVHLELWNFASKQ